MWPTFYIPGSAAPVIEWDFIAWLFKEKLELHYPDVVWFAFSANGFSLYVKGTNFLGEGLHKFTLTTAWDLTTLRYGYTRYYDSSYPNFPRSNFFISDDETKYVFAGKVGSTNYLYSYTMSTPGDLSTAAPAGSGSTANTDTLNGHVEIVGGTHVTFWNATNTRFDKWTLSTPFDATTIGARNWTKVVHTPLAASPWIMWAPGGFGYFLKDRTTSPAETRFQSRSTTVAFDLRNEQAGQTIELTDAAVTSQTRFGNSGLHLYSLQSDGLARWDCLSGWSLSGASRNQLVLTTEFNAAADGGMFFKPDGRSFYFCEFGAGKIWEFGLGTAWNVTTLFRRWGKQLSVASQTTSCWDIFFRSDGRRLYVVGNTPSAVYAYSLATPWDLSSASYLGSVSISANTTNPRGICFTPDGLRMFITDPNNLGSPVTRKVAQYDLGTAWDITTAVFGGQLAVASQDATPRFVRFNNTGTRMYLIGATNRRLYRYTLSTAYDVTTATYSSISMTWTGDYSTALRGFHIQPDGTHAYVMGVTDNRVMKYKLFQIAGAGFARTQSFGTATVTT